MVDVTAKKPDDFVIATGKQYTVRDFVTVAANSLDMKIKWKGKGLKETGSYKGKNIIKVSKRYFRPTEVESLIGNYSKAKKKLGWKPKITFKELVNEMVNTDLRLAEIDEKIKKNSLNLSIHKK